MIWLIDYAQSIKNEIVSVVSESFPHLSGGAMRDFELIMKDRGYWDDKNWIKSPRPTYTFETGTIIEFLSVDTYGKAHGPRRDILFLNEAPNISYLIADQLITRTRKIVWMDWNPTNEFWFDLEMLGKREDVDYITLTYLDNEALDTGTISEIESHKNNINWWRVYGLGELGIVEGRIYKDWEIIDELPHQARLERRGLDFGFSNDPAALVDIYYYNGGYIVDELLYAKGVFNKQIGDLILSQLNTQALVVADSAEPKSIAEIKQMGINIVGVGKTESENKKESFSKWSIQLVQNQRISITKSSLNIIKEYRNYMWKQDRDGQWLNEYEHEFSHSMKAIEYALISILKRPNIKYEASKPGIGYYPEMNI